MFNAHFTPLNNLFIWVFNLHKQNYLMVEKIGSFSGITYHEWNNSSPPIKNEKWISWFKFKIASHCGTNVGSGLVGVLSSNYLQKYPVDLHKTTMATMNSLAYLKICSNFWVFLLMHINTWVWVLPILRE